MTGQRRLGLVAAGATLLAAAPLSTIFDSWTWLLQCTITVGLVAGAGLLARTVRAPLWVQALGMIASLVLVLTWMFPSGEELLALLPTPATLTWFGQLLAEAGADTRAYGVPVPDRDGLLFVAVVGVGSVSILVDMLAVGLRKPALAGLPMLAIYSVPVAVYVDSVPVTPFIVGAVGFLWLLVADNVDRVRRFGRRFTGDGRDVDVWEPSPLAAAGRRLAVLSVVAAVLVPLAVPGLGGGWLSQLTQSGGVGGAGNGNGAGNGRVNLFAKLSGDLNQTATTELLRVTTDDPDPYYLRFGVADVVTESGFTYRASSGRAVARGPLPDGLITAGPEGVTSQKWHASVQVTGNFNMPYAPVYSTPTAIQKLDGNWLYDPQMQVVYSGRSTTRDKKYEFDYIHSKFSQAALRSAPPLDPDNPLRAQFTSVPKDERVSKIVASVVRGKSTEYDKVYAIYKYFKENGFTYRLQTQTGTSGSDIADFLTSKVGFCQQYAAAMAWMAREAGVPARVAFGFTLGSATKGKTRILTNRNLHAWTEVYLEGYGWVPFDATPASGVIGSARSEWAPDTDQPQPSASASATAAAPGATPSSAAGGPTGAAGNAGDRDLTADTPIEAADTTSSNALLAVAVAALLLALLAMPATRRALVRRRRHAATVAAISAKLVPGDDAGGPLDVEVTTEAVRARADAHAAWDELVDTMIDFQVQVDPTETPRHTAERLVREVSLVGEAAEAATLLGRAEERARYARQPLHGGELTVALGHVRRALAGSADRRTRMVALLFPPSVIAGWRANLSDTSGRMIGAASRRRTAASRWNPRRLLAQRSAR